MKHLMIHPNGVTRESVEPGKVQRLLKMGWTEESGASAEVIEFQESKIKELITRKKSEITNISEVIPLSIPGTEPAAQQQTIVEPEIITPEAKPEPIVDYSDMSKKDLIAKALLKGGSEKELSRMNKDGLIQFLKQK